MYIFRNNQQLFAKDINLERQHDSTVEEIIEEFNYLDDKQLEL